MSTGDRWLAAAPWLGTLLLIFVKQMGWYDFSWLVAFSPLIFCYGVFAVGLLVFVLVPKGGGKHKKGG